MSLTALRSRRHQVLALVRQQDEVVARISANTELFYSPDLRAALDQDTLVTFRTTLEAEATALTKLDEIPAAFQTRLSAALDLVAEHNRRIEGFLILCHSTLREDSRRLRHQAAEDRALFMTLDTAEGTIRNATTSIAAGFIQALASMRHDAAAAFLAVTAGYLRTGILDPSRLLDDLERRNQASLEALRQRVGTIADGLTDSLLSPPGPAPTMASPTKVFDPETLASGSESESVAGTRLLAIVQPLCALAADLADWTDRHCRQARDLASRAILGAATATIKPALNNQDVPFGIELPIPASSAFAENLPRLSVAAVSKQVSLRQTQRHVPGMLGTVGRWWSGQNSIWGYEFQTHQQVRYQINLDRLSVIVTRWTEGTSQASVPEMAKAFEAQLEPALGTLRRRIEDMRLVLRSRKDDRQRSEDTSEGLLVGISGALKAVKAHQRQVKSMRVTMATPTDEAVATPDLEEDITILGAPEMVAALVSRLEVTYGSRKESLAGFGGRLTLGRNPNNVVAVAYPGASRNHAEIIFKDGNYVLTDSSTNGTTIVIEGREPVLAHHSSEILRGNGWIGLGIDPIKDPAHAIAFRCVDFRRQ